MDIKDHSNEEPILIIKKVTVKSNFIKFLENIIQQQQTEIEQIKSMRVEA